MFDQKIFYRLKQIDNDGKFNYSNEIEVSIAPLSFSLSQNYPNPFNPLTKFDYTLPSTSHIKLVIYNAIGEEVKVLVDEIKETGYYTQEFNSSGIPSGIYFYQLRAGDFVSTKKLILLK